MNDLEDKLHCPRCGHELHRQRFMMSRWADEHVFTWTQIAWILCAVLVVAFVLAVATP